MECEGTGEMRRERAGALALNVFIVGGLINALAVVTSSSGIGWLAQTLQVLGGVLNIAGIVLFTRSEGARYMLTILLSAGLMTFGVWLIVKHRNYANYQLAAGIICFFSGAATLLFASWRNKPRE